jgi:hypothetical protein
MGMPVDEFVEKAWSQLAAGSDQVIVGPVLQEDKYMAVVEGRRELFESLSNIVAANFQM